jgi:hypothetical protein
MARNKKKPKNQSKAKNSSFSSVLPSRVTGSNRVNPLNPIAATKKSKGLLATDFLIQLNTNPKASTNTEFVKDFFKTKPTPLEISQFITIAPESAKNDTFITSALNSSAGDDRIFSEVRSSLLEANPDVAKSEGFDEGTKDFLSRNAGDSGNNTEPANPSNLQQREANQSNTASVAFNPIAPQPRNPEQSPLLEQTQPLTVAPIGNQPTQPTAPTQPSSQPVSVAPLVPQAPPTPPTANQTSFRPVQSTVPQAPTAAIGTPATTAPVGSVATSQEGFQPIAPFGSNDVSKTIAPFSPTAPPTPPKEDGFFSQSAAFGTDKKVGWLTGGAQVAGSIATIYQGFQSQKLARDQYNNKLSTYKLDYANNAKTFNLNLERTLANRAAIADGVQAGKAREYQNIGIAQTKTRGIDPTGADHLK